MNSDSAKKIVKIAYAMIDDKPMDRLDCLNKALRLQQILHSGMAFLNDVAISPHVTGFTDEDLKFIHESLCDSALPLVEMIEYFLDRAVAEADRNPFVV